MALSLPDRRVLVISGVGMNEGGLLSVLRNVVSAAERLLPAHWTIVVLAHRRADISCSRATVREFPNIKASWIRRMWFEWRTSSVLARELRADVWLAMHDITPTVNVPRQYVYCHNPTCFVRPTLRSFYFDWIFVAHSLFYSRLYALNISRNTAVFVQQSWIRTAFIDRFGASRVILARPSNLPSNEKRHLAGFVEKPLKRWLYPTLPRHFKNVEIIGRALQLLEKDGWGGQVLVTISGNENRYARWLARSFGSLRTLRFIGRQSAQEMQILYSEVDGVIFPSLLETWGLPISEAQDHGLALLVADRQYAHETVGNYGAVTFFDPQDAAGLAVLLRQLSTGEVQPGCASFSQNAAEETVFGWEGLITAVTS